MQRITGDHGVLKDSGVAGEEALGDGQFAILLRAAVALHGHGAGVLVLAEGDNRAQAVTKVFAVQSETSWQTVVVGPEPGIQGAGELLFERVS